MQKLFQALCVVMLTCGFSTSAQAFTIENMSAWSAAGQPLRMDIELSGLAVAQASDVIVRVASQDDHARLGLTRPSWANSVRFQMITLPSYRVVARASTPMAIGDNPVSFLVEIRTPSAASFQQVGSVLGLEPIAAKNPAPERVVRKPQKTTPPVAKTIAPLAKPIAPVPKPIAPVAKVAKAMAISSDDRAALESGLKAAKAQVADLEAQLAALALAEAIKTNDSPAPTADPEMSTEAMVADMLSDGSAATSETTEAVPIEVPTTDDMNNSQAIAAASSVTDASIMPVEVTPLKPFQLFARVMILVVGLILLVFFLLDKIRQRR